MSPACFPVQEVICPGEIAVQPVWGREAYSDRGRGFPQQRRRSPQRRGNIRSLVCADYLTGSEPGGSESGTSIAPSPGRKYIDLGLGGPRPYCPFLPRIALYLQVCCEYNRVGATPLLPSCFASGIGFSQHARAVPVWKSRG